MEAKYRKFNAKSLNKAAPRPVRVQNVYSQLQIDLVDMRNQLVEYENKVYWYILSIMDVFSRFHWLIPQERKFSRHIKPHLEKLFIEHTPPKRLQSDRGKEFKKEVKQVSWNEFFFLLGLWGPSWNLGRNLLTGQNTIAQKFCHLGKLYPTKSFSDKSFNFQKF